LIFLFPGRIDAEVNFWKDLEKKLNETTLQLQHNSVLITRLFLRRYNRVQENGISEAEKELDRALDIVSASIAYLRDFPFDELINLSNKNRFCSCISNILSQFPKLKSSKYEFNRALRLLETVGQASLG
jgi:formylmethanofuran dehydrogenase subunit E-like metal-binding protein